MDGGLSVRSIGVKPPPAQSGLKEFFDLFIKLPICHSGLDPESSDTSGLPNSNYRICPIILIIRCQVAVPDSQFVDMV